MLATHEIDRAARLAQTALVLVEGKVKRRVNAEEMSEPVLRAAYAEALEASA